MPRKYLIGGLVVVVLAILGQLAKMGVLPKPSQKETKPAASTAPPQSHPSSPSQAEVKNADGVDLVAADPSLLCLAKFEGFSLRSVSKSPDKERATVSFESDSAVWVGVTVNKTTEPLPPVNMKNGEKQVTIAGLPGVLSEDKKIPALYINFQLGSWRFSVEATFRDKPRLRSDALSAASKFAEETAVWANRFLGSGPIPTQAELGEHRTNLAQVK